jgi:hypothetical protein
MLTSQVQRDVCTECARPLDLLDPLAELDKDIRQAARELKQAEVRFLVDYYYQMQKNRIRSNLQAGKSLEGGEPEKVLAWVLTNSRKLESNIQAVLSTYTDSSIVGQWSKSICGIGPVISAGLLAHIDIEKAPTVGHIWRFAGLDPTLPGRQQKGVKSPYNIRLKTLCWKIGESFVKVANKVILTDGPENVRGYTIYKTAEAGVFRLTDKQAIDAGFRVIDPDVVRTAAQKKEPYFLHGNFHYEYLCLYSQLYEQRKVLEIGQNDAGMYSEQAANKLATTNIGKETEAYGHYIQGKLPPAHIHARAKRYAVKIFLSHWHHVSFEVANGGKPPAAPYVISQLGHVDYLAPPNWPMR